MPAFLVAMVGTSLAVWAIGLPVETIGSRFGEIPSSLPLPSLPAFSLQQAVEVLPSAFTIAFLAGIESLLSDMVDDGITGARHPTNLEMVAQRIANHAPAFSGRLPGTGDRKG